jgi:hypothetical protein
MRWAMLVFASLAIACSAGGNGGTGTGTSTQVKDTFNHACATNDDCVSVYFGNTCGFCNETNSSIAKSDRDKYQKEYNAARASCPQDRAVGECAVNYAVSQCAAGKCVLVNCGDSPPKDEHTCKSDGG